MPRPLDSMPVEHFDMYGREIEGGSPSQRVLGAWHTATPCLLAARSWCYIRIPSKGILQIPTVSISSSVMKPLPSASKTAKAAMRFSRLWSLPRNTVAVRNSYVATGNGSMLSNAGHASVTCNPATKQQPNKHKCTRARMCVCVHVCTLQECVQVTALVV